MAKDKDTVTQPMAQSETAAKIAALKSELANVLAQAELDKMARNNAEKAHRDGLKRAEDIKSQIIGLM